MGIGALAIPKERKLYSNGVHAGRGCWSLFVESTDDDEIHDAFHVSGANVYEGCLYIHEDGVLT